MSNVFSIISPVMFGTLWDTANKQTDLGLKILSLLGGVLHFVGYLLGSSIFMLSGYLFLVLSATSIYSVPLANLSIRFMRNKIGGFSVFYFWFSVC